MINLFCLIAAEIYERLKVCRLNMTERKTRAIKKLLSKEVRAVTSFVSQLHVHVFMCSAHHCNVTTAPQGLLIVHGTLCLN